MSPSAARASPSSRHPSASSGRSATARSAAAAASSHASPTASASPNSPHAAAQSAYALVSARKPCAAAVARPVRRSAPPSISSARGSPGQRLSTFRNVASAAAGSPSSMRSIGVSSASTSSFAAVATASPCPALAAGARAIHSMMVAYPDQFVFDIGRSVLGQPWRWRGKPGSPDDRDLTHQLFRARGAHPDDFARLSNPTLRDWLPDPSTLRDMDAAAARLAVAVTAREPIIVFGDYDVDGATSAALMVRVIRELGGTASPYIPDRILEGYGPSPQAMAEFARSGARLVLTVDCGTQGFEALDAAHAHGLDVIVVDHHKAGTALPRAVAVVNPNRLDEGEGAVFGHLAAVGVCFLLAVALVRTLRAQHWFAARDEPKLTRLLDLVALGTVADVASLTGLNRAFVSQGLKVMATRRNPGLAALADVAALARPPTCGDLGFIFGPRINAGGRVGRADLGVRLLLTDDADEALALALELDGHNSERRALEVLVQDAAAGQARGCEGAVVTVTGHGWHPGVIGIVAGRLKELTGRPSLVIAIDEHGVGKGSGRSITGVDLGAAVLAARDMGLLLAGGGHAMAAGLTVAGARIPELTAFLCDRLAADVARARENGALYLDAALAPGGVCPDTAHALEVAGPYGVGWPRPRVAAGPCRVLEAAIVGDKHVRLLAVGACGTRIKAVAFRTLDTPLGAALLGSRGRTLYLAGTLQRDTWQGRDQAEIHLEDCAFAD